MSLKHKLTQLAKLSVGDVTWNAPLREHCTWRIGGPADLLVEPLSVNQLGRLLTFCFERKVPSVIIGKGSNLLFADEGVRGVVIKMGSNFAECSITGNKLTVQSGAWVPALAQKMGRLGLSGLEHTVGIPCTMGGLIVMNGGSRRCSISEVLHSVTLFDKRGNKNVYSKNDCGFSYRHSKFLRDELIIVEASFLLHPRSEHECRTEMLSILRERRAKFPRKIPNCGSVFKSSPELYDTLGPPGKVLDDLGVKGMRVGDAQVSDLHANFILNLGRATARDVLKLIGMLYSAVENQTGFRLQTEPRYVTVDGKVKDIVSVKI